MKIVVLSLIAVASVKKSSAFGVNKAAGLLSHRTFPISESLRTISTTKNLAMSASKKSEEVTDKTVLYISVTEWIWFDA